MSSSLLDSNFQNFPCRRKPSVGWNKKQKRAYMRIKSGIQKHAGERLRFITLTSPPLPLKSISDGFSDLVKRIKRWTPEMLYLKWFIDKDDLSYFYRGKALGAPLKFEYLRVLTSEGPNNVIHCLYYGDYIPQQWLSCVWDAIVGAYVVDIKACQGGTYDSKKLTSYVVTQYLSGGQTELLRTSWSAGWVVRGFVSMFRYLLKKYGYQKGLEIWTSCLPDSGKLAQLRLAFEKEKPPPEDIDFERDLKRYQRVKTHEITLDCFVS